MLAHTIPHPDSDTNKMIITDLLKLSLAAMKLPKIETCLFEVRAQNFGNPNVNVGQLPSPQITIM